MALSDTISNLPFIRLFYQRPATTSDEPAPPQQSAPQVLPDPGRHFDAKTDRRSVVNDCRVMYAADPRIRESIARLARDVTRGGFTFTVAPKAGVSRRVADQAAEAVKMLIERLDLFVKLDDYLRLTERDGDSFIEVSIDSGLLIQELTRKQTLQMRRYTDDKDRFVDPRRAFWQANELFGGLYADDQPPKNAVFYARWQIIHARLLHDEGSRYGTPRFGPARTAWKLVTKGERDMGIRRAVRATMRYSHEVLGSNPDIEAYVARNKIDPRDADAATRDFYGAKVTAVQGDATLGDIGDIKHHMEVVEAASPVPFALLAGGRDLNRDVLEDQKSAYYETILGVSDWLVAEIVKPLVELQWLLLGLWPDDLELNIEWYHQAERKAKLAEQSAKATESKATAIGKVAESGIKMIAMGWPDEVVDELSVNLIINLFPDKDEDELLTLIRAERKKQQSEIDPIGQLDRGADVPPPEPQQQRLITPPVNGRVPVLN